MTAWSNRPDSPAPRPLSNWVIAVGALVVLAVVAVILWVLLGRYGGQGASVQLDAIRTGGTLVIGAGGAVALLLTARRQRYIELSLVHTDRDATERRITELYTKAADQLGSEQAPVRLASLYALERLAHSTVEQRQNVVDVICAYLRMSYTPPPSSASVLGRSYRSPGPARRRRARTLTEQPPHATPTTQGARHEQQVRLTAQKILVRSLRVPTRRRRRWWQRTPPPAAPAWPGIELDLNGAVLHEFSLAECQLDSADFARAQFTGKAGFENAQFTSVAFFGRAQFTSVAFFGRAQFTRVAVFEGAQFTSKADFGRVQFISMAVFEGAQFTSEASFGRAQFASMASFGRAQFTSMADFEGAQFTSMASFGRAQFTSVADFEGAQFTGMANFRGARFTSVANFRRAQFTSEADFGDAQFTGEANFEGARVASAAGPGSVWLRGWTTRLAKPEDGEDPAFLYLTEAEEAPDS